MCIQDDLFIFTKQNKSGSTAEPPKFDHQEPVPVKHRLVFEVLKNSRN